MNNFKVGLAFAFATLGLGTAPCAVADPAQAQAPSPSQAPAPLGVFGADMPAPGHWVFALLGSAARLQDNYVGARTVSGADIVTNVISPSTPAGAHVLRLGPTHSAVESEGVSVTYGLSPNLILFASTAAIQKDVDLHAYQGLSGATSLGFSVGKTSGLGDTTIAAIARVYHDATSRVNVNLGLCLPTGSTTENMVVLLPDGASPSRRAFYAMQPGAGTVDLLPGVTYSGVRDAWSWGASYRARLPLDHGSQGWAYGDLHELNAWGGYSWRPGLETTLRLNATTQGAIRGQDPRIRGYAQGSNPAFYGGQQVGLSVGAIVGGQFFRLPAAQFGVEAGAPFYQDLNGPQLGRNWQVNVAFRYRL